MSSRASKNKIQHISYFIAFSCHNTCQLIRTTSPFYLDLTLFSRPPSLSVSLVFTCHFLSLLLLPAAISEEEMNIMLNAEALREEGAKKFKHSAFSQWASKSCHIRDAKLLSSYALLSPCQSTRYLTHSRHTSAIPAFLSSVLSLNGLVSFSCCWITFSAAHRHCMRNPLNSSSHSLPPRPLLLCLALF